MREEVGHEVDRTNVCLCVHMDVTLCTYEL